LLNELNFKPEVLTEIKDYLQAIRKQYISKTIAANKLKDNIYSNLVTKLGGDEAVYKLKQDYYNNNLAEIVQNRMEVQNFYVFDNRIIRIKEPIYEIPENKFGRAKLYASVKFFFGNKIETYWFNIMFIWFSTIIFYLVLYYDLLRKLLDFLGDLKLRK